MRKTTTDPSADESGETADVPPSGTIIYVMGVSGCGKSTIARLLAQRLGAHWRDGDELHPPDNIERMSSGIALTDADREPWLEAVRDYARDQAMRHATCVVACSALKRRYRELLGQAGAVFYVFLEGSFALIHGRMHEREGHFMPDALLQSQFDALDDPRDEPGVITVSIDATPESISEQAEHALLAHPGFVMQRQPQSSSSWPEHASRTDNSPQIA